MAAVITKTLDVKGMACPLPIARTAKVMRDMASGEVLEVLATDPGSVPDFNAWSKSTGNPLLEHTETDGVFRFLLEKR